MSDLKFRLDGGWGDPVRLQIITPRQGPLWFAELNPTTGEFHRFHPLSPGFWPEYGLAADASGRVQVVELGANDPRFSGWWDPRSRAEIRQQITEPCLRWHPSHSRAQTSSAHLVLYIPGQAYAICLFEVNAHGISRWALFEPEVYRRIGLAVEFVGNNPYVVFV